MRRILGRQHVFGHVAAHAIAIVLVDQTIVFVAIRQVPLRKLAIIITPTVTTTIHIITVLTVIITEIITPTVTTTIHTITVLTVITTDHTLDTDTTHNLAVSAPIISATGGGGVVMATDIMVVGTVVDFIMAFIIDKRS